MNVLADFESTIDLFYKDKKEGKKLEKKNNL
jgi:hypothetical protein